MSRISRKSGIKFLSLLVGLTLIRGVIYIAIVPPWLAPDEPAHFEAIRLIGQENLLPTRPVYQRVPMHPEMQTTLEKFTIWQISGLVPPQIQSHSLSANTTFVDYYPPTSTGSVVVAGNYPLFYHMLLSPISRFSQTWDIVSQLYVLRFISLGLTVITIVTAWYFAQTIFPNATEYPVALSGFLVFLPMHLHVNTSVNTDVLATVLTSLYFLMLAKWFVSRNKNVYWIRMMSAFMILALLIKPTAIFTLPTTLGAVLVYLRRRYNWSLRYLVLTLGFVFVIISVGTVFFYQLTGGGRSISVLALSTLSFDSLSMNISFLGKRSLAVYLHTIRWGFLSFWGLFGWANLHIPLSWIRPLWVVSLVIGGGVMLFFMRQVMSVGNMGSQLRPHQKDILLVLLLSLIFAVIGIYTPIVATQSVRWGPPSRYFFPALLPFGLFAFLGFRQLFPPHLKKFTLPSWLIMLILYDSTVLGTVLLPWIYG